MKRKIAVVLCVMLCLLTLFGCSSTELGYLEMYKDLSNIKSCQLSGVTEIYYDAERIKEFILDNADSEFYSKEEIEDNLEGFTGKKTISLAYDGSYKMVDENIEYYLDFTATIDGKKFDLGDIYISTVDGIYVERDMIINLYKMSKDVFIGYKNLYFYSEDYEKSLRTALGNSEYIEILSAEQMQEQVNSNSIYFSKSVNSNTEFNNKTIEFLKNLFKGYTSEAVTNVSGGYKVSITGDSLIKIVSDCLGYMSNNIDVVLKEISVYMSDLESIIQDSYELNDISDQNVFDNNFDYEMTDSERAEIAGGIAAAKTQLDYLYKKGELDIVKPFSYTGTVKKLGKTYVSEGVFSMDSGSKNLGYIKTKTILEPKTIKIDFPKRGTKIAQVSQNISDLEKEFNSVKKIEISWEKSNGVKAEEDYYWGDDYEYCDIYYSKEFDTPFSSKDKYDWCEYKNLNKEMYVPFRQIAEYFGEDIGWDNINKKAYIIKDNKKVFVEGILDTKTVFVRVRDFEKLGYNINYNGTDPYFHYVTIEKN